LSTITLPYCNSVPGSTALARVCCIQALLILAVGGANALAG